MADEWWIAQGEDMQGPFTLEAMHRFVRAGKATEELYYSVNGGDWTLGSELPELFAPPSPQPGTQAPARERPGRSRRTSRSDAYGDVFDESGRNPTRRHLADETGVPMTIKVAASIVFLGAALKAVAALLVADGGAAGNIAGLVILGMGLLQAVIGFYVLKGSDSARIILILLSLLSGLSGLKELGGPLGWLAFLDVGLAFTVAGTLLSDSAVRHCRRASARPSRRRRRY